MKSEKLATASTRTNLKLLEDRLKSIERGHVLLKCKGDALNIYFRNIENSIVEKRKRIDELFKESFDMISEAEYLDADIEGFSEHCCTNLIKIDQNACVKFGIEYISYSTNRVKPESRDWRGKYTLLKLQSAFNGLLNLLIEYSSEERLYKSLKDKLEETNKRKNALEHNLIPRLKSTTKYIEDEMEELEREDFFRLKKIQSKKFNV